MTLALVRHGRTAWNADRRMQGRTDIVLDEQGRCQAVAAGRLLARAQWARVVSSPLQRAVQSAQLIAAELAAHGTAPSVALDAQLIERDYGRAEGLAVGHVRERWPDGEYPDAEPASAATARAHEALTRLAGEAGDSVVVAHGTLLRLGVQSLTGSPCPRILNGQVILVDRAPGGGYVARLLT